MYKNDQQDTTV